MYVGEGTHGRGRKGMGRPLLTFHFQMCQDHVTGFAVGEGSGTC